jgi:hypothetical protein
MTARHIRIALCLLGLTGPSVAFGQTQARDSTARSLLAGDSTSASDSAFATDSASASDSAASADTMGKAAGAEAPPSVPDSLRGRGTSDSLESAAGAPPIDTILGAACSGSGVSGSTAPDLLVVIFAPEAGKAGRAAAARSVKGRLLGGVSSEPGAYYLWVPAAGQESRLRAAADRLIRSDVVRQVGSRACPANPPADTASPDSSTRQPSKP